MRLSLRFPILKKANWLKTWERENGRLLWDLWRWAGSSVPPHLESGGGSHNISCSSDSTLWTRQPNISTTKSAQHQLLLRFNPNSGPGSPPWLPPLTISAPNHPETDKTQILIPTVPKLPTLIVPLTIPLAFISFPPWLLSIFLPWPGDTKYPQISTSRPVDGKTPWKSGKKAAGNF